MRHYKFLLLLVSALIVLPLKSVTAEARTIVSVDGISRGTIIVETGKRRLYYGIGNGKAIAYPVGVGRTGRQWKGRKVIRTKRKRPAWKPTADILADTGGKSYVVPGGSPKNPMGAAALVLSGDGQYAIHGTNNPKSIGGFVSYGCIRMHNKDILDLYSRVWVGTRVVVK